VSITISTGATSSTPSMRAMVSPTDSCMTALETAKKIEELGDCTMISAPTPSTRLAHSAITPVVNPTIKRIRKTCKAMATTLSVERSGRAPRLFQSNLQIEKP